MSRLTLAVLLVAMWVLMWGRLSVANVLSGILVVGLLYVVFPSSRSAWPTRRVHPLALLHLAGFFLWSLLAANVSVTRAVLGPRSSVRTGFVTVPLCVDDKGLITLISTMTTLTPGSIIVEVSREPAHVRVHSFGHADPVRVATTIRHLEELCIRAIGNPAHQFALDCRLPMTADDFEIVEEEDIP
jgi:multicomponent Na+:H+ antiporter subunit E